MINVQEVEGDVSGFLQQDYSAPRKFVETKLSKTRADPNLDIDLTIVVHPPNPIILPDYQSIQEAQHFYDQQVLQSMQNQ